MSFYRFITASDLNPTYCGFIPTWISHHKKLFPNSDIYVILVSDTLPENLERYKDNILLFKPLPDMHTSYQAQLVRMVYGALLSEKQNIICDMDMYILSNKILKLFDKVPNMESRFVNFGCLSMSECQREKQLPLFFSIYSNKVINEIFEVKNLKDIHNYLIKYYKKMDNETEGSSTGGADRGYNWFTDQLILYEKFINYTHLYKIERRGGDRLDRDWFNPDSNQVAEKVNTHQLVDFHAPRPYNKYEKFIERVLSYVDFSSPPKGSST